MSHKRFAHSRRDFSAARAAAWRTRAAIMLRQDGLCAAQPPLSIRSMPEAAALHTPKAKSVIWLFMEGGPSHIDLFDPKPELEQARRQAAAGIFGQVDHRDGHGDQHAPAVQAHVGSSTARAACGSPTGLPHIAQHVDDMRVIRSCWADGLNHVGSVCQMNTGSILGGRPSLGAWITYGLGTANQNLPAFVVLTDAAEVVGGPKNWSSGFMPAAYQGTQFRQTRTRRSST